MQNPILKEQKLKWLDWMTLLAILAFAFAFRFYRVNEVPAGIFCDEASIGYNAFALGKYGIDENGEEWPMYIRSFGGYKNPTYVYTAIVPIKLMGLNETSLRLTSVFYGVLAVLALFWLCYEIWNKMAGFIAAILFAITPWHIHFSRIAFELIALPAFFLLGFAFLIRSIKYGRWNWLGAGLMFGLMFHTYVMAVPFIALFLPVFIIVYIRGVWRHKIGFIFGVVLFGLIVYPGIANRYQTQKTAHFASNTWITKTTGLKEKAKRFYGQYQQFYSMRFLFYSGDGLIRHNVSGYGELHKSFIPFILLGFLFMLIHPDKWSFLIVWWVFVFPVGAAMTNDIYATRSLLGSPIAATISGYGISRVILLLSQYKWRWIGIPLLAIFLSTGAMAFSNDMMQYLKIYYGNFYRQSARGYYGFQFGYRDTILFMESLKDKYPQKILTSSEVNQPYIFALFYSKLDPLLWKRNRQTGYIESTAEDYDHYRMDQPTLYAMRDHELQYFTDFEVLKKVTGPDDVVEFVIADVKKRKEFLRNWITLGLLKYDRNESFKFPQPDPIQQREMEMEGLYGPAKWMPMNNPTTKINLNQFFGQKVSQTSRNPENCCADAATFVLVQKPVSGWLEVRGSGDMLAIWFNHKPVFGPLALLEEKLERIPITLLPGWNSITFRSCEGSGDWYLVASLVDENNQSIPDMTVSSEPPPGFTIPVAKEGNMESAEPKDPDSKLGYEEDANTASFDSNLETNETVNSHSEDPSKMEEEMALGSEASMELVYNPHFYYQLQSEYPNYVIVDEIDLEDPFLQTRHDFMEDFSKDAPYQHNYHTKNLRYVAPVESIRLEDDGRRIFTKASWIVFNVDTKKDLVMIVRYDGTGGAQYKLKVNEKALKHSLDFPAQTESWNEVAIKIPDSYLKEIENKFELTRQAETETDAEMFYFWFIQSP